MALLPENLSRAELRGLEILAVIDGYCPKNVFYAVSGRIAAARGDRPPKQRDLRQTLSRLAGRGLIEADTGCRVVEPVGESVRRGLIEDGRYEDLAAHSAAVDPLPTERWGWYRVTGPTLRRELRRALLANDPATVAELYARWEPAYGHAPDIIDWVTQPLDAALLGRLDIAMTGPLLNAIDKRAFERLRPEKGLAALIKRLTAWHPTHPELRCLQARRDLCAGRVGTDAVKALDGGISTWMAAPPPPTAPNGSTPSNPARAPSF